MRQIVFFFALSLVSGCGQPTGGTTNADGGDSLDGTTNEDAIVGQHDLGGTDAPVARLDGNPPDATNVGVTDLVSSDTLAVAPTDSNLPDATNANVDLTGIALPDLVAAPDMNCGAPGQKCCTGGTCDAVSACVNWGGSDNYCAACGQAGEACCPGSACDTGLVCGALGWGGVNYAIPTCVRSTASGSPYLDPGSPCGISIKTCGQYNGVKCSDYNAQVSPHCTYCGGPGQPGCSEGCQPGLGRLVSASSVVVCTQCGYRGETCCDVQKCIDGSACGATGRCQ